MVLRYGINPKLSNYKFSSDMTALQLKVLTVKDSAAMEHGQSESKYPLEVFLNGIQGSTLFVWHLFVDLEGCEQVNEEGHRKPTSFSPKENTGTRSALMRPDKRVLGTCKPCVPMHHRHFDKPHSAGKSE